MQLADMAWTAFASTSAMTSVYSTVLDGPKPIPGGLNAFEAIQDAWSGGVCVGDELFVWGGGHADGANNQVFAVNAQTGEWRRVGPAPTQSVYYGVKSQTNPDGSPAARHTYNLMATDGVAIYVSGGAVWNKKGTLDPTLPPPTGGEMSSWRLDLASETWTNFAPSPTVKTTGNLAHVSGKLYHLTSSRRAVYDIATDTWSPVASGNNASVNTVLAYSHDSGRLYGLGGGYAWYRTESQWLTTTRTEIPSVAVSIGGQWGVTYYPPERRILLWDGGASLITYSEISESWETITPTGDSGPSIAAGTYGRLSYCGGRVILINGINQPLYYLAF